MKFRIYSGSADEGECPLEGAVRESCLRVDERTFKSPEEHDARLCGPKSTTLPWLKDGLNHRLLKDGIARDFPDHGWFIEIASLEALIELSKKVGDVEISTDERWAKGFHSIEINMDHR